MHNFHLPNSIYSTKQIYSIDRYIKLLLDEASKMKLDRKDKITRINVFDEDEQLNSLIKSSTTLYDLLDIQKKLNQCLIDFTNITIVLSDIPSRDFKIKLVRWFRSINPNLFIDFKTDSSIVGGIIIRTNNRNIDLSLSSDLKIDRDDYLKVLDYAN